MYKIFLFLGLFFLLLAAFSYLFQGGFLGRLPGDIIIEREHFTLYFPVTTMIVVSLFLTLLINLFKW